MRESSGTTGKALLFSMMMILMVGSLAMNVAYTVPKMQDVADRIEKAVDRLEAERDSDAKRAKTLDGAMRMISKQQADILLSQSRSIKLAKEWESKLLKGDGQ